MEPHQRLRKKPANRTLVRLVAILVMVASLGWVFVQRQQYAEFRTDYEICRDPRPDPEVTIHACDRIISKWPLSEDALALSFRHRSRAQLALKKFSNALEDAQSAISAHPEGVTSWALMSHVLVRMKDYSGAFEAIETALELSPEDDYSQRMKLEILIHNNEIKKANRFIDELKQNHPYRYWIFQEAGRLQMRDKDFQSAAVLFASALNLNSDDKYSLRRFFEACRLAEEECPLLFPDTQDQSQELSCDEVFPYLTTVFPDWEPTRAQGNGYADLQQYLYETPLLQSGVYAAYLSTMRKLENNKDEVHAERFIGLETAIACIQNAQAGRDQNFLELEVQAGVERAYPLKVRQNLLQWAYKVLTLQS